MLTNEQAVTACTLSFPSPLPGTSHSGLFNKRSVSLQDSDNLWWDAFATEFFEDDATLTLSFCLEDGPKRYSKREVCFSTLPSFCASRGSSENSPELTAWQSYRLSGMVAGWQPEEAAGDFLQGVRCSGTGRYCEQGAYEPRHSAIRGS